MQFLKNLNCLKTKLNIIIKKLLKKFDRKYYDLNFKNENYKFYQKMNEIFNFRIKKKRQLCFFRAFFYNKCL
jgi:hypothetical protein